MTVAVAYSSTPQGRAALEAAAELAGRLGESLAVLHAVRGEADADTRDTVDPHGGDAVREEVAALLAGTAASDSWRLQVCAAADDVPTAVLDLVDGSGASLLVVGARHRSPVGKLLLGTTLQRLVRDCPVPVLTVKPRR